MAEKTIKIKVTVDDNGNLVAVGKKAKDAAKGLNGVAEGSQNADRRLKGVAQASSNSTKNFSKMAQGINGGLVPAYATLAANIFAITAAFQFLKSIGELRTLEQSQLSYSQKTGQSLGLLTSRVQDATEGLLKYRDAAEAVSIGKSAGLSSSQIEGLAGVAKNASIALGRDLTDSFNRLTRGAIKAEPELLDELGIIVRLETATEEYARSIGKTAKELTTWEKSQAVVNQVLKQGQEKFADLNVEVNGFVKLGRAFDDLLNTLRKTLAPFAEFLATALVSNVSALAGAFLLLGANITKSLVPAARDLTSFEDASKQLNNQLKMSVDPDTKTKTGQKIIAGEDLTKQDMSRLKASLAGRNSTIFVANDAVKDQARRTILSMEAQQEAYYASTQVGIKRSYAFWKAELKLLQSQHGVVMGTMVTVATTAGRAISTALSWLGWIGLAVTLFGIIKTGLEYFKSDAIKEFEERIKNIRRGFENQVDEIKELMSGLKETNSLLDSIAQTSNLLSNFSFKNFSTLAEDLKIAEDTGNAFTYKGVTSSLDRDVLASNREIVATAKEGIPLLEQFQEALNLSNIDNSFADKFSRLTSILDTPVKNISDNEEAYAAYIENLRSAITELVTEQERLQKILSDSASNFQRLSGAAENYSKIKADLVKGKTPLAGLSESLVDAETSLDSFRKQLNDGVYKASDTFKDAFGDNIAKIEDILGKDFADSLEKLGATEALDAAITALAEKREAINAFELKQATDANKLAIEKFDLLKGLTSLQSENVNREIKVLETQRQIQAINEQITFDKEQAIERSAVEIANQQLILELLTKQNEEYERQLSNVERIKDGIRDSLSSSFQSNLSELIQGTEKNIKEAIANIGTSVLESIADNLSKDMTDFILGKKDPLQIAREGALTVAGALQYGAAAVGIAITQAFETAASLPSKAGEVLLGETKGAPVTSEAFPSGTEVATTSGTIRSGGIFSNFINGLKGIFDPNSSFLDKFKDVFFGGADAFKNIFGGLGGLLTSIIPGMGGGFMSLFARNGGVFSQGRNMPGYATGGIARGANAGYPAMLHGTEAVVPLPDGKSIPVSMQGAGQQNNVTVNVSVDSQGNASTNMQQDSAQAGNLGQVIARAVQQELQNQKRSGGILNPYGAA